MTVFAQRPTRRPGALAVLAAAALAACLWAGPVLGQGEQRIAAVVNDEIVTLRDLEGRARLAAVASRLPARPETLRRLAPRVLQGLIDERLQLQEAERLGVGVDEREIVAAKRAAERRLGVEEGGFDRYLAANGVAAATAVAQLRASIAWGKLVRRRFAGVAQVAEEEIDEALEAYRRGLGRPQYRFSEIFLPVDGIEREGEVRDLAARLRAEIRAGGDFAAIARQFSASPSALRGGAAGWAPAGRLAPEIDRALEAMAPGEVAPPIRTVSGYRVVRLEDRRVLLAVDPLKARVALKHVFLPLPADAGEAEDRRRRAELAAATAGLGGCAGMAAAARRAGSPAGVDLGEFEVGDLVPAMRDAVANLAVGAPSAPVRLPGGLSVVMVCARTDAPRAEPSREEIAIGLRNERLSTLARRYLRDLRRDAFVETRI